MKFLKKDSIERYDSLGRLSSFGMYDKYGRKLSFDKYFTIFSDMIKDQYQKHLVVPTDKKEIKRRALTIRLEIEKQKRDRLELAQINEDLELIKFDARIKGKLKHDDSDYLDRREKQDLKELQSMRNKKK